MRRSPVGKRGRGILRLLVLPFIVWGCMGLSCDSDAAATFRSEAAGEIGEGVRTIMNGILDGVIAAVEQAGDGSGEAN